MDTALIAFLEAWIAPGARPIEVATALDRAVLALTLPELTALAGELRVGEQRGPMRHVGAEAARQLLARAPCVGGAGILSLHRNGYVRQEALEALADTDDPGALRFFALRLDDIVPSLGERARVAIERRLVPRYAADVAALLPLVRRLGQRRRAGGSATLHLIDAFLVDPGGGREALLAATRAADPALRLAACVLAGRRGELGDALGGLLGAALADGDRALARWAALEITSTRVSDEVREQLLPRLDAHRDPSFRRRAVLARARGPGGEPYLRRALVDPRAAVRRAAREKLRDGRSRELYRSVLGAVGAARKDVLGALAGLAEVGRAEDAALALPWTAVDEAPVQAEAIRCVGLLDGEAHVALLEAACRSRYGRVRREGEGALARLGMARPR